MRSLMHTSLTTTGRLWNDLLPDPGPDVNGAYLVILSNGKAPNAFMYTTEGTYNTFIPSTKKWKLNFNRKSDMATLESGTANGNSKKVFSGGLFFCQVADKSNVGIFPATFNVSYTDKKEINITVIRSLLMIIHALSLFSSRA